MKSTNLVLGMAIIALVFTSCKNEKEIQAKKSVETYVVYVDSIGSIDTEEAKKNWEAINASYQLKMSEAEMAVVNLNNDKLEQEKIDATKVKYQELKTRVDAEKVAGQAVSNPKQELRNALFGIGRIGDNMDFNWVNASNIHQVYQSFVHTAEDNKDKYTREDWDEIKLMYEALDSRKNTVEKEGLSKEDNRKISGLKIKFAPMLKVNRMGAKSEEMAKAKN